MSDINAKGIVEFAFERDLTHLYKRLLEELEELRNKHEYMMEKLHDALPSQYHPILKAADYLDEKEFQFRRKKILDVGNDTKRNLLTQVGKFRIEFPL